MITLKTALKRVADDQLIYEGNHNWIRQGTNLYVEAFIEIRFRRPILDL